MQKTFQIKREPFIVRALLVYNLYVIKEVVAKSGFRGNMTENQPAKGA